MGSIYTNTLVRYVNTTFSKHMEEPAAAQGPPANEGIGYIVVLIAFDNVVVTVDSDHHVAGGKTAVVESAKRETYLEGATSPRLAIYLMLLRDNIVDHNRVEERRLHCGRAVVHNRNIQLIITLL
jgi:hypothetical protein